MVEGVVPQAEGPPTQRLFVALWPDEAVRSSLVRSEQDWGWPRGASLVPPERLHVTLHFLGDVPVAQVDVLRRVLRVPLAPFTLRLDRCSVWPTGVAVLEASAVPPELRALHASLARALRAAGVVLERRPFAPHVTFARRARAAVAPRADVAVEWPVRGYALVQSLRANTHEYRVIQRYGA